MLTLIFAGTLTIITLTIGKMYLLVKIMPSFRWRSFTAGVSVSYVIVELLPEIAHADRLFSGWLASPAYLLTLIGLVLFYILDQMAVGSRRKFSSFVSNESEDCTSPAVFWVHTVFFALYHFLIGELLVDIGSRGILPEILFCVVLVFHFYIMDEGLRRHHHHRYDKWGRWILALALFGGALTETLFTFSGEFVSATWAVIAGGIMLNTLKEELPESKQSCLISFIAGTTFIVVLLQLIPEIERGLS